MKTIEVDLTLPDVEEVTLNRKDSALIVVDMQNEGKALLGERVDKVIPNVAQLIRKFRDAGSKIIYVQSVRKPDALEFTVFNQSPILLENTWAVEIIEELAPLPGEPIVQKWSHDCFNNTKMEEVLKSLDLVPGRSQIVVTGVATNVCFDCAFTGFRVRDYFVYCPLDGNATFTQEMEVIAYQHFDLTRSQIKKIDYFDENCTNVFFTKSDMISFE